MRRLPPLNAVRAFEAAARHVSFTKAADELHVTHGAVSRQVAGLEDWFGVKLFRRSPSQLTLTDVGQSYLREVTAVLDRLALASMNASEQAAPKVLRIDAPPTFTMRWLMGRLSRFQRLHSQAELRLTASLVPISATEFGCDVCIRGNVGDVPGWQAVRFMTEIIAPVCHVDLLAKLPLRAPDDLHRHTLITYQTEPYSWPRWCAQVGMAAPEHQAHLRFEQMFFALQAVQEQLGIGLFPLFLVIDELVSGRFCVPFGTLGARRRFYSAFHRSDAEAMALIRDFCGWLRALGQETEASTEAWTKAAGWGEMNDLPTLISD